MPGTAAGAAKSRNLRLAVSLTEVDLGHEVVGLMYRLVQSERYAGKTLPTEGKFTRKAATPIRRGVPDNCSVEY